MAQNVSFAAALHTWQREGGGRGPVYQGVTGLAQAAEATGFDTFWLTERQGCPE